MPGYVKGESKSVPTIEVGAFVGGLITRGERGMPVRFQVVSGPNKGVSGVAKTDGGSYPINDIAFFKYSDSAGLGANPSNSTDTIRATSGSGHSVSTDTVQITWTPPTPCQPTAAGFLQALGCAKSVAKSVLELGECTVGVASFFIPAGDLVKIVRVAAQVKDATRLIDAEHLVVRAANVTPIARLAADIHALGNAATVKKLATTLSDASDAKTLIESLWNLSGDIPAGKLSDIVAQVANLAGLGSCVSLIEDTVTAPAAPVAPPASPAPPSVVVPTQGPTLAYIGNIASSMSAPGDATFDDFAGATGQQVQVVTSLPSSLSGYRCAILDVNTSFSASDEATLEAFLRAGGTVLALGEHAGGDFDTADAAINLLATQLGVAGLALDDDQYDANGDEYPDAIVPSPLTANVGQLGDNFVSGLTVTPPAQSLVYTADDDTVPLVAYQSVGSGTFVMSGDSNIFTDNNDSFYIFDDNGAFADDLCP